MDARLRILLIALCAAMSVTILSADARPLPTRDLHIDTRAPRTPATGAGVIVLSTRSITADDAGGAVSFGRIGARAADDAPPAATIEFTAAGNDGDGKRDPRIRKYSAFQAAPGRYAMVLFAPTDAGTTHPGRQYCFATIGFDLAAGDVLYIGDYVDTGAPDPALAFDMNDARNALSAAPALQGALRPARIIEGIPFACRWADMAQYRLNQAERALLISANALPAQ